VQPKPPSIKGPTEWFTGDVWIDPIVQPGGESSLNIGAVHFTPGAPEPPGTRTSPPMVKSTGTVRPTTTS